MWEKRKRQKKKKKKQGSTATFNTCTCKATKKKNIIEIRRERKHVYRHVPHSCMYPSIRVSNPVLPVVRVCVFKTVQTTTRGQQITQPVQHPVRLASASASASSSLAIPTVESRLEMATLSRFFLLSAGSSEGSAYGRIERWTIVGTLLDAEGSVVENPTPVGAIGRSAYSQSKTHAEDPQHRRCRHRCGLMAFQSQGSRTPMIDNQEPG